MSSSSKMSSVTLRDVAEFAGTSLATASSALGHGGVGISQAARDRVQRAADELGYQLRARGRPRKHALSVGVVVPEVCDRFYGAVAGAIAAALTTEGHRVILAGSGEEPAAEEALVRQLAPRIDALAIAPAGPVGIATEALASRGAPVVLFDRTGSAPPTLPSVSIDNFDSTLRATMILVESGRKRIAMVSGPLRVSTVQEMTEGYRAALTAGTTAVVEQRISLGNVTLQDGRRAVDDLLHAGQPPDAIISTSATLTCGVLTRLRDRGLRWPEDVAVVGFGDGAYASLADPGVTVIDQPAQTMGRTVAGMLLARGAFQEPPQVVLSSRLVLRDSHWRRMPMPSARRSAARWPDAFKPG